MAADRLPTGNGQLFIVLLLATLLVGAGMTVAAEPGEHPSTTIEVNETGDALWTVTNTVDLASRTTRAAFDKMAQNRTRREELLTESVGVYRAVANGSSQHLQRGMAVTARSINLTRNGQTGIITIQFSWSQFARSDGDRLIVGDVFAGGYPLEANRSLTIQGPDSYRLTSHNVSTRNGTVTDGTVTWEGPAIVRSSIELIYEPTESSSSATPTAHDGTTSVRTTGESGSGFGIASAVPGLLIGVVLIRHGITATNFGDT